MKRGATFNPRGYRTMQPGKAMRRLPSGKMEGKRRIGAEVSDQNYGICNMNQESSEDSYNVTLLTFWDSHAVRTWERRHIGVGGRDVSREIRIKSSFPRGKTTLVSSSIDPVILSYKTMRTKTPLETAEFPRGGGRENQRKRKKGWVKQKSRNGEAKYVGRELLSSSLNKKPYEIRNQR